MSIIRFRVEERTIDVHAAPDTSGLMNHTRAIRGILTAPDRDGALRLFRTLLDLDPDRYKPGEGYRLVLVEDGDR